MNCTVCGNPLLFDRVAFHCSCGAFVHAYCWDQHVVQAHPPPFEMGTVNLDGEFIPRESKVEVQASETETPEAQEAEEQVSETQTADEESSEEQTAPLLE